MKCWKCKHVGNVPGSVHRSCRHPKNKDFLDDPFMGFLGILAMVGRSSPQIAETVNELGIKIHPHGLKMGWANWPWNFDPNWILECNGYEERETENDPKN